MREFNGFNSFSYQNKDGQNIWYAKNFESIKKNQVVLIFNYGLVCTHQHWQHQINHFHSLGLPILLHDYRGHYTEESFNVEEVTISNIVNDLNQLVEQEKIKSSYILGHSMGVNISLEYAVRYPEKVKKLVLITGTVISIDSVLMKTSLFESLSFQFANFAKKVPSPLKKLWKTGLKNPLVHKVIHHQGFNHKRTPKDFIKTYTDNIDKLPVELFFQLLEEMRKHQVLQSLDDIDIPTLIVKGGKDNIIPPEIQNLIHQEIDKSELFELKMGSHVPQIDFPLRTNKRIEEFLTTSTDEN